jgi:hypothetical protein
VKGTIANGRIDDSALRQSPISIRSSPASRRTADTNRQVASVTGLAFEMRLHCGSIPPHWCNSAIKPGRRGRRYEGPLGLSQSSGSTSTFSCIPKNWTSVSQFQTESRWQPARVSSFGLGG